MCPLCSSNKFNLVFKLYDDRYGFPNKLNLFVCNNCGHKFLEHKFSDVDLMNLYSNYYPRSDFSIDNYKPLEYKNNFSSWLNGEKRSAFTYVPKGVKILDIGCGFGQSIGYHLNRGCEVYGVEADSNIQKVIDKYSFNIHVGLFDSNNYEKDFFDYVTLDQVLEHTVDPKEVLLNISTILTANGKIIISVPNGNGWGSKVFGKKWINWHTPYHLQHFSKSSINHMINKIDNLNIIKMKTITSSEWLYYQINHIINFPKIEDKSQFWSNGIKKKNTFQKKILTKFVNILYRMKVFHLLTRIFDSLNIGDNLIIELEKNI